MKPKDTTYYHFEKPIPEDPISYKTEMIDGELVKVKVFRSRRLRGNSVVLISAYPNSKHLRASTQTNNALIG